MSKEWKIVLKTSAILSRILSLVFLWEIWYSDSKINDHSCFKISSYNAILFERKANKWEGSIRIYVKTDLMYKIRK